MKAVLLKIASEEIPSTKLIRTKARADHRENKIFKLRTKFKTANSAALLSLTSPRYIEATPELAWEVLPLILKTYPPIQVLTRLNPA